MYDADAAGEQAVRDPQETVSFLFDGGGEDSLGAHVGVLVQDARAGHAHVAELDPGVVDPV